MNDRTPVRRAAARLNGIRSWVAGYERYLWAGVFTAVLIMQWPMLKGLYYRAANTPVPPTSIEWRTDLAAALVEARRTDKQVLVDFSADWCPPCIAMKHDVWPNPGIAHALGESYVPVLIDADRDTVVSERYGVSGIPTILVLDDTGQVLRRAAFLTAPGMMRFLTKTD